MNRRVLEVMRKRSEVVRTKEEIKKRVKKSDVRIEMHDYVDEAINITLKNPVIKVDRIRSKQDFNKLVEQTRKHLVEYYLQVSK